MSTPPTQGSPKQYLICDEGQTHALQLTSRLAEHKVVLLGLGDDEVELDLLSYHGVREGKGVQGGLIELGCEGKGQSLSSESDG